MIYTIDLEFLENACTVASYFIDSGEGLVLIETGPHSTFEALKKGIEMNERSIEEVKHVLLTHIHLDHAGAAWALAESGANIYVHPQGKPHLVDPTKLLESAKRIYEDKMDSHWGEMKAIPEEKVVAVEHEEKITLGNLTFTAWHSPGHANHHIAWQVDKVVFTGDVAGVQIGKGPIIAPLPPPDIDLEKWSASIEILKKIDPIAFYLTHYGAVTNTTEHLDGLWAEIQKQANWVKEQLDAGKKAEDIIPEYEEFTKEELAKLELSSVELSQYMAASPPYMNVQGLARYWEKKA